MAANNHTIFFIKNRFKYADYYSCLRFWLLLFFALYEKMAIHCKKVLNILNSTICKFMFQTTEKALTYQIGE